VEAVERGSPRAIRRRRGWRGERWPYGRFICRRERRHSADTREGARVPERRNTYFTGGLFRFAYDGIDDVATVVADLGPEERDSVDVGSYTQQTYHRDLMRVTGGRADPELGRTLVSESLPTMVWMREKGVRWVLAHGRQAFRTDGRSRFWGGLVVEAVGGGKDLSDRLFELASDAGVTVLYDVEANGLLINDAGAVDGISIRSPEGPRDLSAGAVVLACGGFEANAEMREEHLGPLWRDVKVRGTRYNTGDGIRIALEAGAGRGGDWGSCHAVAWDLNAPPYGDRTIADLYQKHSYQFGIVVNVEGRRFVDEGADFRNYTYARYGREILRQPEGAAFQIFDSKVDHLLRDEYRIPQVSTAKARSIVELADALGIDRAGLVPTVAEFNGAVREGAFDPTALDGKGTAGIDPPKSNWAQRIDTPPFSGYAVACGITFTFGGLSVDKLGRANRVDGRPLSGLFAAGEIVGGLFHDNYPGGAGLMAGAVFGRIAGAGAASYAMGS
jgi:tricarballylate dehydrogenase